MGKSFFSLSLIAAIASWATPSDAQIGGWHGSYTLPPKAGWEHGHCQRRGCQVYQETAIRYGVFQSKHSTLYPPRFRVQVGGAGRRGEVVLTNSVYSYCSYTAGKECSIVVTVSGKSKSYSVRGRGDLEFDDPQDVVAFVGASPSFILTYLDEKKRSVRLKFDATD